MRGTNWLPGPAPSGTESSHLHVWKRRLREVQESLKGAEPVVTPELSVTCPPCWLAPAYRALGSWDQCWGLRGLQMARSCSLGLSPARGRDSHVCKSSGLEVAGTWVPGPDSSLSLTVTATSVTSGQPKVQIPFLKWEGGLSQWFSDFFSNGVVKWHPNR